MKLKGKHIRATTPVPLSPAPQDVRGFYDPGHPSNFSPAEIQQAKTILQRIELAVFMGKSDSEVIEFARPKTINLVDGRLSFYPSITAI